jgi:hypothetical protein
LAAPIDSFIIAKTEKTVIRVCPFCDSRIEDLLGKDINFIVHLGTPTLQHREKKEWTRYITKMKSG